MGKYIPPSTGSVNLDPTEYLKNHPVWSGERRMRDMDEELCQMGAC